MNTIKKVLVVVIAMYGLVPISANAETIESPVLVVDKCPEFCPKPITSSKPQRPTKPPKPPKALIPPTPPTPTPPVQMCIQVLIPVPNRPGYWYTDGCMKKIIGPVNGNGLLGKVPFKK